MPFLESDRADSCPACARKMDAAANPRNPRLEIPASISSSVRETDARCGWSEFSRLCSFFLLFMTYLLSRRFTPEEPTRNTAHPVGIIFSHAENERTPRE